MYILVQLLLLVLMFVLSTSTQHVHYVKPDGSPPEVCPDQPCLTIDQYVQRANAYFTTGAHFLFLAGNYRLQATIRLVNISDITLAGKDNESDAIIYYGNSDAIQCINATNFCIQKLTFILHDSTVSNISSAIKILNSKNVEILNLTFKGSSEFVMTLTSPVFIYLNSDVSITSCVFKRNTAYFGGALYVVSGSNVILDGNMFIGNRAVYSGAIHVEDGSILTLKGTLGNTFAHNSAVVAGGAIGCLNSSIDIVGNNMENSAILNITTSLQPYRIYFFNNSVIGKGGGE